MCKERLLDFEKCSWEQFERDLELPKEWQVLKFILPQLLVVVLHYCFREVELLERRHCDNNTGMDARILRVFFLAFFDFHFLLFLTISEN